MNKYIFIINGFPTVGKDTFVQSVSTILDDLLGSYDTVMNYSSIDRVKEIGELIGYTGGKSEKERKFLAELKALADEYYDLSFRSMRDKVLYFSCDKRAQFLFLHIREPHNIDRAVKLFNAETILITRDSVTPIISNESDKNVLNYEYTYTIDNSGDRSDLMVKAKEFINTVLEKEKK